MIAAACGAPVSIDDDLIESALGAHWEGLSWTEVRTTRHARAGRVPPPSRTRWTSWTRPSRRSARGWRGALRAIAARHPGQEVVVVSHGDPIKAAVCHLMGTPIADMHALPRPHRRPGRRSRCDGGAARIVERWAPAQRAKR